LRFLRWATADRLVYALAERVLPLPPVTGADGRPAPNPDGPTIVSPVYAVDADGGQHGVLVDARHFLDTSADARRSLADLLRTTQELVAAKPEEVRWRMPRLELLGFFPAERGQLIVGTRGGFGAAGPAPCRCPHRRRQGIWRRLVGSTRPAARL
jgi:hypothetical protein